jgi:putative CocE/NonD family hydrolase
MYEHLAQRPGVETRIDVNACTHKGCGFPFDPAHDPNGYDNFPAIEFDFMSHYLLGTEEHPTAPVRFYQQPFGPYVSATEWPPPDTTFTRFYLHPADGGLAGVLSTKAPVRSGDESYFTDPLAGWSMALNSYGTIAISPYVPTDQRLETEQGLTWRTAPGHGPLRIAGPIQLHLAASSTVTDTDWVARLSDVAPDGSESVITEGALRASHRAIDRTRSTEGSPYHLDASPQPLAPDRIYHFDIAIIATAYTLAPGHSLQLRLTTDDMPTRLPGSIEFHLDDPSTARIVPLPPATNTVQEDPHDPSWLLLPVATGR